MKKLKTFSELIEIIEVYIENNGNVSVNCKNFVVTDLKNWLKLNTETINTLKTFINALQIVKALEDSSNILPVNTKPEKPFYNKYI